MPKEGAGTQKRPLEAASPAPPDLRPQATAFLLLADSPGGAALFQGRRSLPPWCPVRYSLAWARHSSTCSLDDQQCPKESGELGGWAGASEPQAAPSRWPARSALCSALCHASSSTLTAAWEGPAVRLTLQTRKPRLSRAITYPGTQPTGDNQNASLCPSPHWSTCSKRAATTAS